MEISQKSDKSNKRVKNIYGGRNVEETKVNEEINNSEVVKVYTFESNSAGGILCVLIYAKAKFVIKK